MHYCDGTEVKVGDVATRAPSPGNNYDGGLVDGEGGLVVDVVPGTESCNVTLAYVEVTPNPYAGSEVLARRSDGSDALTFGMIARRTCTAAALRLVRRARSS
jgi:hypothetical protein